MKLKSFFMMLTVALCTVACGNDEDETQTVADVVVGTYSGTLDMTVSGNSVGSAKLSVVVTKSSDHELTAELINQEETVETMSIGRIKIENIQVSDEGNAICSLTKPTSDEGFTATDTGSASQIVWKFKSFSGTVNNGTLELDMLAQPGAMPMPITLKFSGTK